MKNYFSNKLAIFIFAFPALFLFTAFVIYPIFPELLISFQKNDGFRNMGYIGLENYIDVLNDPSGEQIQYFTYSVFVHICRFTYIPCTSFDDG